MNMSNNINILKESFAIQSNNNLSNPNDIISESGMHIEQIKKMFTKISFYYFFNCTDINDNLKNDYFGESKFSIKNNGGNPLLRINTFNKEDLLSLDEQDKYSIIFNLHFNEYIYIEININLFESNDEKFSLSKIMIKKQSKKKPHNEISYSSISILKQFERLEFYKEETISYYGHSPLLPMLFHWYNYYLNNLKNFDINVFYKAKGLIILNPLSLKNNEEVKNLIMQRQNENLLFVNENNKDTLEHIFKHVNFIFDNYFKNFINQNFAYLERYKIILSFITINPNVISNKNQLNFIVLKHFIEDSLYLLKKISNKIKKIQNSHKNPVDFINFDYINSNKNLDDKIFKYYSKMMNYDLKKLVRFIYSNKQIIIFWKQYQPAINENIKFIKDFLNSIELLFSKNMILKKNFIFSSFVWRLIVDFLENIQIVFDRCILPKGYVNNPKDYITFNSPDLDPSKIPLLMDKYHSDIKKKFKNIKNLQYLLTQEYKGLKNETEIKNFQSSLKKQDEDFQKYLEKKKLLQKNYKKKLEDRLKNLKQLWIEKKNKIFNEDDEEIDMNLNEIINFLLPLCSSFDDEQNEKHMIILEMSKIKTEYENIKNKLQNINENFNGINQDRFLTEEYKKELEDKLKNLKQIWLEKKKEIFNEDDEEIDMDLSEIILFDQSNIGTENKEKIIIAMDKIKKEYEKLKNKLENINENFNEVDEDYEKIKEKYPSNYINFRKAKEDLKNFKKEIEGKKYKISLNFNKEIGKFNDQNWLSEFFKKNNIQYNGNFSLKDLFIILKKEKKRLNNNIDLDGQKKLLKDLKPLFKDLELIKTEVEKKFLKSKSLEESYIEIQEKYIFQKKIIQEKRKLKTNVDLYKEMELLKSLREEGILLKNLITNKLPLIYKEIKQKYIFQKKVFNTEIKIKNEINLLYFLIKSSEKRYKKQEEFIESSALIQPQLKNLKKEEEFIESSALIQPQLKDLKKEEEILKRQEILNLLIKKILKEKKIFQQILKKNPTENLKIQIELILNELNEELIASSSIDSYQKYLQNLKNNNINSNSLKFFDDFNKINFFRISSIVNLSTITKNQEDWRKYDIYGEDIENIKDDQIDTCSMISHIAKISTIAVNDSSSVAADEIPIKNENLKDEILLDENLEDEYLRTPIRYNVINEKMKKIIKKLKNIYMKFSINMRSERFFFLIKEKELSENIISLRVEEIKDCIKLERKYDILKKVQQQNKNWNVLQQLKSRIEKEEEEYRQKKYQIGEYKKQKIENDEFIQKYIKENLEFQKKNLKTQQQILKIEEENLKFQQEIKDVEQLKILGIQQQYLQTELEKLELQIEEKNLKIEQAAILEAKKFKNLENSQKDSINQKVIYQSKQKNLEIEIHKLVIKKKELETQKEKFKIKQQKKEYEKAEKELEGVNQEYKILAQEIYECKNKIWESKDDIWFYNEKKKEIEGRESKIEKDKQKNKKKYQESLKNNEKIKEYIMQQEKIHSINENRINQLKIEYARKLNEFNKPYKPLEDILNHQESFYLALQKKISNNYNIGDFNTKNISEVINIVDKNKINLSIFFDWITELSLKKNEKIFEMYGNPNTKAIELKDKILKSKDLDNI